MPLFSPLVSFWRWWVALFARQMPLQSPAACMAFSVLFLITAFTLLPNAEGYARGSPLISDALNASLHGWRALRFMEGTMMVAACAGAWAFQARCLQICYPEFYDPYAMDRRPDRRGHPLSGRKKHGFTIAGMPIDLDDMRTSILVTGVTGSSKTAGVLMPALAQLFAVYNEETDDELSANEFQKIGAFIPEVKGDLVDGCVYLAHEAGRCVSRDVLILSPVCRIPVVRYRDEEGRCWFLSGRGGSGGSDAGELIPRLHFPPGHSRAGRPVPGSVFESPADVEAVMPELSGFRIQLGQSQPRFVGWRWDGGMLLRVSHTEARDRAVPLPGPDGQPQRARPPQTLVIEGVAYIDNGIHFNLVDPRLPAAEAAERLTRLAAMARGGESRGDNDYFYEQGRKLIAACISLHRATASSPCTAVDIVRLATQEHLLASALDELAAKVRQLEETAAHCGEEEKRNEIHRRQITPLNDLSLFFRDEWQKMVADGKTANVIKSTISGAFDAFLQDPNLAETFCQPSTFSFEDIAQSGRIIGLVPGDQYEQLGRLLGTACKMDFQSAMLSRNGRADLNSTRLALYFADECHKYIISGSSTAGDPSFMNLSRSNNVVNICATQSYAWIVEVIGREAANVYISAFGVQFWLQQTDPETCRRAAEICGTVTREKVSADHDFNFAGLLGALSDGKELVVRHHVRSEEKERHRAEDFSHLNVGEIIAYNKGRQGRTAKVGKGRASYIFCTQKPAGHAAVGQRMREYYREVIENITHERGQDRRWDAVLPVTAGVEARVGRSEEPSPLTAAQIERERADFTAYTGSLDACAEEMSGVEPRGLAIVIESARRQAEASPDPPGKFGETLGLGFDGMASDDPVFAPPARVPPQTAALPYSGDLAVQVAEQARQARARHEGLAQAALRRDAPRPKPDSDFLDPNEIKALDNPLS